MKGITILVHSIRLLLNNVDVALRVSLVPYVALAVINGYIQVQSAAFVSSEVLTPADLPSGGLVFQIVLLAAIGVVLSLWIAVAWHRFVLTGEAPSGFIPAWHGAPILAYFGRGLVVVIALAALTMLLMTSVGLVLPPVFGFAIVIFCVLIVFYRICAVLPAAAVGERLTIGEAWTATKGETGTIVILSIIGAVVLQVLQAPTMLGGDPNSMLSLIYSAAVGWFTMLIGVSVLTTFYGHFVHKRPID